MVLVMSVNPGFGGQSFIPRATDRIRRLRQLARDRGLSFDIEVDGGINDRTAREVVAAGANVLVAGSHVFGQADYSKAIAGLRAAEGAGGGLP
jgi:ribulose-phosphate 3-epimerase